VPLRSYWLHALQKKQRLLKIRRLLNPSKKLQMMLLMQWTKLLPMQATRSAKLATTLKRLRKMQAMQWTKQWMTLKKLSTTLRTNLKKSQPSNRSGPTRIEKGCPRAALFL